MPPVRARSADRDRNESSEYGDADENPDDVGIGGYQRLSIVNGARFEDDCGLLLGSTGVGLALA
jgi:hypothetical protein